MGYFLAVSAFRTDDCNSVQQGIVDYCRQHGVSCVACETGAQYDEQSDASLYTPVGGWIRVLWPPYFNIHDFPLCRSLAAKLRLMASTVHVYDSDYWVHLFLNREEEVHRFSSYPAYWAENAIEAEKLRERWRGDPQALSALLGVPCERICPYLVHLPLEPAQPPAPLPARRGWLQKLLGGRPASQSTTSADPKAHPSDDFDLKNFWVFTDFWRQLGIIYPDPIAEGIHSVLRLGDFQKLPAVPDEDAR